MICHLSRPAFNYLNIPLMLAGRSLLEGETNPSPTLMLIRVKVQTRSSIEKIEEVGLDEYKIWVTVPPADNQANEAAIDLLADYFNTPPSKIRIKSGYKSSHKLIEIGR